MATPKDTTPLGILITRRMMELGIDDEALGLRLGFQRPERGQSRVREFCLGNLTSRKSRATLPRLAAALEVPQALVDDAVHGTRMQQEEEARVRAQESQRRLEEAERVFRATFRPHAIIETTERRPSSITVCAFMGGPAFWLRLPIDVSRPKELWPADALAALRKKLRPGPQGRPIIPLFGEPTGFVINHSPDHAVRYDLEGNQVKVLGGCVGLGGATVIVR